MGEWEKNKPIASAVEKIAKECAEAGCNAWTITKIVKAISGEENASEKTLRKKTMELLTTLDPQAAQVYASFQRMMVRTSGQTIAHFDRGNIIRSLLKETNVTRGVAEKIGHEVEEKIKDLEISYISTALIREMVNVKLLEYGHENIRGQYARIGLPVFDIKRKLTRSPRESKGVLSEYNLLRVIPRKFGEMHLRSEIFIACIEDFSTKPVALHHKFEPKENLNETIFSNLKKMSVLEQLVSWPINAESTNIALLPFCKKRGLAKSTELFLQAFESIFPKKTDVERYLGIGLFVPDRFNDGIERNLIASSVGSFIKETKTLNKINTKLSLATDTKYKLKLLNKNQLEHITIVNCLEKELVSLNGIASDKNLCGMFGVNLSKAASAGKEYGFFNKTSENLKAVKELAQLKKNILSKRNYLKKENIDAKTMLDCVGIYGLMESAHKITQGSEKEAMQFAEKTVSLISKELGKGFVLAELLNRKGIKRFEAENKKAENTLSAREFLLKSDSISKKMQIRALAENKKEASRQLERGIKLVEMQ
jgi:hypothetical protein